MNFQGFCDVTFPIPHFFPKLSESVVNRMKDCSQPSAGEQLAPGFGPSSSAPVPTVPEPTIPVPTAPAPTTPVPTAPSSSVHGPPEGTYKGPLTGMLGEICLAAARLAFTLE